MKHYYLKLIITKLILILVFNFDVRAQWQKIPTPYGGYIQCFIEKDNVIYSGTADNGLFYSKDNGIQWSKFSNSPGLNIKSLTVNAEWIFTITEKGFFKSKDNGLSWQSIIAGSKNYDVKSHNGIVYLSDDMGIYTSIDNGLTWSLNDYTRIAYSFSSRGNSLIATTWGANIFVLNDLDMTWQSKYIPYSVRTSAGAVYNNKIYIGTWGYGVYVSSNGGDSWKRIIHPSLYNGYISHIAINGNTIYVCSDAVGVFSSSDEGATWNNLSKGLNNLNFTTMFFSANKIFTGTYSGIYSSIDNGSTWNQSDNGIQANFISAFALNKNKYFLGTNHGLQTSEDNGQTWLVQSSHLSYETIKSIYTDENNVFVGTTNGLYYSSNNGANWAKRGLNEGGYIIFDITKYKDNYLIATNGGIFMTSNFGTSWVRKTSNYPDIHFSLMVKDNIIYSGGLYGAVFSNDECSTWNEWKNLKTSTGNAEITMLESIKDIYFANTNFDEFGLYVSYDKGLNWIKKEIYPRSMTSSKDIIYIGTNDGLLSSSDGINFTKSNILTTEVISLLENYNDVVFACVNSLDLWQNKTVTGIKSIEINKLLFYPNPADKEIVFKNIEQNNYIVKIIDMTGRVIINQLHSFNNKVTVSNLANGIYVIEITDNLGKKSINKLKIQHLN